MQADCSLLPGIKTSVVQYNFRERDGKVPFGFSTVFGFVIQLISF